MRVTFALLSIVSVVTAYDAVVFSNEQKITKDFPSFENLISTASSDAPLVFIVNPDFTLGQFSRQASAYTPGKNVSGLAALVKASSHHASRFITDPLYAHDAVYLISADNFAAGAAIYILMGEEWSSMQSIAEAVLPKMGNKYTAIITASEAVYGDKVRAKRVATSDMENDSDLETVSNEPGAEVMMPLNLPPYNRTEYPSVKPSQEGLGSCMMYMEGVNIIVQNSKKEHATIPIRSNNTKWSYNDGDVKCVNGTVGTYSFTVRITPQEDAVDYKQQVKIAKGSQVVFQLVFNGTKVGYWTLVDVIANSITVEAMPSSNFINAKVIAKKKAISATSVQHMGIVSVQGFALGCSDSQAAFFNTDRESVLIGISLYNTQIQPFGVFPNKKTQKMQFTHQVEDCVGTFSPGSWMGIVTVLILLGGFFFGYLMLNSVQTMDRFDDPKHKQIVINVRE